MILGEAPGYWESQKGLPFVGKSGQILQSILTEVYALPQELFVANTVKHRPPSNRDPSEDEVSICGRNFLQTQIDIVRPRLILCVGKVPAKAMAMLADTELPYSRLRGRKFYYRETPVFITWHPAYVMRNPDKRDELVTDIANALHIARTIL